MPFNIVRDDIVNLNTDAIVNAANSSLLPGSGVCGRIFSVAGHRDMQRACSKIGYCATGKAVITDGFNLKARYVIHTVGPVWGGGNYGEEDLLRSCYRCVLSLAREKGLESVAFPLISSGSFGFPKNIALSIAVSEISAFLLENDMTVYLVVFDKSSLCLSEKLFTAVTSYIDDNYVERYPDERMASLSFNACMPKSPADKNRAEMPDGMASSAVPEEQKKRTRRLFSAGRKDKNTRQTKAPEKNCVCPENGTSPLDSAGSPDRAGLHDSVGSADSFPSVFPQALPYGVGLPGSPAASLTDAIAGMDSSFTVLLFELIDMKGKTDVEVYKRANIDRKHFSKIRSNENYRPTKQTVLALAVSLELTLSETRMLLERAGFALSHSNKADIIIEFFIKEQNYDIYEINEVLFSFDQQLLGA